MSQHSRHSTSHPPKSHKHRLTSTTNPGSQTDAPSGKKPRNRISDPKYFSFQLLRDQPSKVVIKDTKSSKYEETVDLEDFFDDNGGPLFDVKDHLRDKYTKVKMDVDLEKKQVIVERTTPSAGRPKVLRLRQPIREFEGFEAYLSKASAPSSPPPPMLSAFFCASPAHY